MQQDENIRWEIENMLRQKIGLNPESVGSRSILRAVKRGMRTGKMQRMSDYWSGLQSSPEEFTALVESVVVPETSFFRNRASFVFLRQWIAQEWKPQRWKCQRPLRVLSMPCSTGEEPYSVTITLLEEGLTFDEFQVDAVDISARAIEKAQTGVYSPYAFRRQTYRSDDKYFTLGVPTGVSQGKRITQRYYLADAVREKVSFRQGNVLDPTLLANQLPYDVIFCRNLLIYFDPAARDRTFSKLNQLLNPDGLLFLGYAEAAMVDTQLYHPVPYPQTFAYRKRTKKKERLAKETHRREHCPSVTDEEASSVNDKSTESSSEESSRLDFATELQSAQALADSGDIERASVLCDRYLADQPSDAAAHLLRGELHQASGDDTAAENCYEKAIYLDPYMEAALTHLMLLKEESQDTASAALLKKRLQRLSGSIS